MQATKTEETLETRGNRYGSFETQSKLSQDLKYVMHITPGWHDLQPYQRESLEMIQHKIARILNGDPTYADSWHDIAGYAVLVEQLLEV